MEYVEEQEEEQLVALGVGTWERGEIVQSRWGIGFINSGARIGGPV
jgi:hypothetical protein